MLLLHQCRKSARRAPGPPSGASSRSELALGCRPPALAGASRSAPGPPSGASSRWRGSNPRYRYGRPGCRHNTSPAAVCVRTPDDRRARSETRSARSIASWAGWESNPRRGGLRDRCKASVCYRPTRRTTAVRRRSHPLESNQDLPGFSRARRPHAPGWVIRVPAPAGTHVVQLFGCQGAPRGAVRVVAGGPPAGPRRFGGAAVLGPGFEPGSGGSEPSVLPGWTSPVCQSQVTITARWRSMSQSVSSDVGRPGFEPGGSSDVGVTGRSASIAG